MKKYSILAAFVFCLAYAPAVFADGVVAGVGGGFVRLTSSAANLNMWGADSNLGYKVGGHEFGADLGYFAGSSGSSSGGLVTTTRIVGYTVSRQPIYTTTTTNTSSYIGTDVKYMPLKAYYSYSFDLCDWAEMYIGVSGGAALIQADFKASSNTGSVSGSDQNVTWVAGGDIGFAFKVYNNLYLNLGYNYSKIGDTEFNFGTVTRRAENNSAHQATVKLTYRF